MTGLIERIQSIANTYIPEGPLKEAIIDVAYNLKMLAHIHQLRSCDTGIIMNYGGVLRGEQIIFPDARPLVYYNTLRDMPSYFMRPMLKPGDKVVDAGAYPGDFTVLASRRIGSRGHITALEPDPENRAYLEEMLEINNVRNVIVLPYALCKQTGTARFRHIRDNSALARFTERGDELTVETRQLDDLRLRKIDVIKMDIEGAELDAILGAVNTLSRVHPRLMIASYHLTEEGKPSSAMLEHILPQVGYSKVATLNERHPVTYASH
jgi:FkbM family methyltransferase